MKTQQNEVPYRHAPHAEQAGGRVDADDLRVLEADTRLQVAFPWTKYLDFQQRRQLADELAHHPAEMTNRAIDDLLVRWHARADAARSAQRGTAARRRAA